MLVLKVFLILFWTFWNLEFWNIFFISDAASLAGQSVAALKKKCVRAVVKLSFVLKYVC
jgi:hypothetical protein